MRVRVLVKYANCKGERSSREISLINFVTGARKLEERRERVFFCGNKAGYLTTQAAGERARAVMKEAYLTFGQEK